MNCTVFHDGGMTGSKVELGVPRAPIGFRVKGLRFRVYIVGGASYNQELNGFTTHNLKQSQFLPSRCESACPGIE